MRFNDALDAYRTKFGEGMPVAGYDLTQDQMVELADMAVKRGEALAPQDFADLLGGKPLVDGII